MKRKIIVSGSILAGVIALALIILVVLNYAMKESYNDTFFSSVKSEVIIHRGDNGMPSIEVKNSEDLYYALGYLHSQDRSNYIEYFRAMASAQVVNKMGKDGELLNRLSMSMGFSRDASVVAKTIKDPYKKYLQSYVDGINRARKKGLQEKMMKRDWVIEDVISILLMKEWANSFLNNKENFFRIPASRKAYSLKDYFPEELLSFYNDDEEHNLSVIKKIESLVETHIGTFNRGFAAYVPDAVTKSGEHFVAYSMDDKLSVYPGWYPVDIKLNKTSIKALTCSGMPFILGGDRDGFFFIGFNLDIDVQDFVIEKVKVVNNVPQYLSAGAWRNFNFYEIAPEKAEQGKKGQTAQDKTNATLNQSFRFTENGPVLNDIFTESQARGDVVVLKFSKPDADYIYSLFDIPFSKDMNSASASLYNISSLPKVYLFADKERSLKVYTGKMPARLQQEGVFKQSFNAGWTGLIDFYQYNGLRMDSTAYSFYPAEMLYAVKPYAILNEDRYLRIKAITDNFSAINSEDIEKAMTDTYPIYVDKFVPVFLSILSSNPTTSARLTRIFFHDWNYSFDVDQVAPTIFNMLLVQYMYMTYRDDFKADIDDMMKKYTYMSDRFYKLVSGGKFDVFDDTGTADKSETREMMFDMAFLKATRNLNRELGPLMNEWKWGSIHKGHFRIPYEDAGIINRILYSIDEVPYEGGFSTAMNGSPDINLKPQCVSSMHGYFSSGNSRVSMKFAYSTNPMSEFYYGKMKSVTADFEMLNKKYVTKILPGK